MNVMFHASLILQLKSCLIKMHKKKPLPTEIKLKVFTKISIIDPLEEELSVKTFSCARGEASQKIGQ